MRTSVYNKEWDKIVNGAKEWIYCSLDYCKLGMAARLFKQTLEKSRDAFFHHHDAIFRAGGARLFGE